MHHVGACHCVELAYVFNNLQETIYTGGLVNGTLAKEVQNMWVNFAKTGNPSTDHHIWREYNPYERRTLSLGKRICDFTDPLPRQRKLIGPLVPHFISTLFDRLDLNVPYIRKRVIGSIAAAVITAAIAKCIRNNNT